MCFRTLPNNFVLPYASEKSKQKKKSFPCQTNISSVHGISSDAHENGKWKGIIKSW